MGYTLFLPWSRYKPETSKVRLRVAFTPAGSPSAVFTENAVTLADGNGVIRERQPDDAGDADAPPPGRWASIRACRCGRRCCRRRRRRSNYGRERAGREVFWAGTSGPNSHPNAYQGNDSPNRLRYRRASAMFFSVAVSE